MDYLLWRLLKDYDFSYFSWILWYIWKNHNDKIYKNNNGNPQEILRATEVKGALWAEVQLSVKKDLLMVQQAFDWQSLG